MFIGHFGVALAVGRYGFWSLMALVFLGWVSSLVAGAPPDTTFLAWGGMTMWLTVPWGWRADKHRELVSRN